MIIAGEEELKIGARIQQQVSDLSKEWVDATFIVEREATLDEMYEQLDSLGYPRSDYHPFPNYKYYKVLVD